MKANHIVKTPIKENTTKNSNSDQYLSIRHVRDGTNPSQSDLSPNPSSDTSNPKSLPSSHYHSVSSTPSCESEQETVSSKSKFDRTSNLDSKWDLEFAQRMYDEEKKLAEEEDFNLAQAQRLADKWAEEEEERNRLTLDQEKLNAQKAFSDAQHLADSWARQEQIRRENEQRLAREAERLEREAAKTLRKDRKVASRIQRQTKNDEEYPRIAGMRAEERQTVGFEKEKKAKLAREKKYAQEVGEQNRILREATRRRYEDNVSQGIPLQRASRPYQQTFSSQQRAAQNRSQQWATPTKYQPPDAPLIKKAECVSCMELGEKSKMAFLPCKHTYCGNCVSGNVYSSNFKNRADKPSLKQARSRPRSPLAAPSNAVERTSQYHTGHPS